MKVLSIRDPWATLIARGVKDVENRSWSTRYRGPVAIQVSQNYDTAAHRDPVAAAAFVDDDRVRKLKPADMPRGVIIAVVDLVDVHRHRRTGNGCDSGTTTMRASLCSLWGQPDVFHHRLENPRLLAEPVTAKGSLGLRELTPDVLARVLEQL